MYLFFQECCKMTDENTTKPCNERLFKELIFRKIRLDANLDTKAYMKTIKNSSCGENRVSCFYFEKFKENKKFCFTF